MGRLDLVWEGISPCTPAPSLGLWPLIPVQHQFTRSHEQLGAEEAQEREIRASIAVGADQSPDKGPELARKDQGRAGPAHGGLRGCHGDCHGHPGLAEVGRGHQLREWGLAPVSISQPTRRP